MTKSGVTGDVLLKKLDSGKSPGNILSYWPVAKTRSGGKHARIDIIALLMQ